MSSASSADGGGPPRLTDPAHCGLQDGIEASFRSVQVPGDPLLLQLSCEVLQVARQPDDALEGKGGVAVGPRLLQPAGGGGTQGEEEDFGSFMRSLCLLSHFKGLMSV